MQKKNIEHNLNLCDLHDFNQFGSSSTKGISIHSITRTCSWAIFQICHPISPCRVGFGDRKMS